MLVDLAARRLEIEPAVHHLDAQMVLFVDHHTELFVWVDRHGPGAFALGVLPADQLALDEELAVELRPDRLTST